HQRLEIDHAAVDALGHDALLFEHEGHPAAHAGGEVPAEPAEHHHHPAGHVLAAVIADGFHHRLGAAVAHGKALAGSARDVHRAAGRAVEHHVAGDHVLVRRKARAPRRIDDDVAAAQALAHVVVGLALELEGHALGE